MGRVQRTHGAAAGHPLSKEGYERISATNPGGLSDKLLNILPVILALLIRFPLPRGGAISARSLENTAHYPLRAGNAYGQLAEQLGRPGAARAVGAETDRIPSASSYLAIGLLAETHHDRICRRSSAKRVVIAPRSYLLL